MFNKSRGNTDQSDKITCVGSSTINLARLMKVFVLCVFLLCAWHRIAWIIKWNKNNNFNIVLYTFYVIVCVINVSFYLRLLMIKHVVTGLNLCISAVFTNTYKRISKVTFKDYLTFVYKECFKYFWNFKLNL